MDLQPIAVMLQLVRPARTDWRPLGDDGLVRMNESGGGTLSLPRELRRRDNMRVMGMGKTNGLVFYRRRSPQHRPTLRNSRRSLALGQGKCGLHLRWRSGPPSTALRSSRLTAPPQCPFNRRSAFAPARRFSPFASRSCPLGYA
jgi:hypothetical protein